jgi:ribose transport system substrate-binding protein
LTVKKTMAVILLVAIAGLLAACGSSSSTNSATSSTSGGAPAEGSPVVQESEKVAKDALSGVVYSAADPTKPSEVQPYGAWRGPTAGPPPKKGATVEILLCTGEAAACVETGKAADEAMKKLGWHTETIDGRGTPEGFARAFDLAISRHPAAILSVALPTAAVSAKLKEARERGIYLVVVADADKPPAGVTPYDAYVSSRQNVSTPIMAWSLIVRSKGKANVLQVRDPGFPVLVQAQDHFAAAFKQCSGCTLKTLEWQITEASNATKVVAAIRAAVTSDPGVEYIQMPYSIGIPFVLQALRQMGKSNIQVVTKDLPAEGVKEVAEGSVLYDIGNPLAWLAYAAVNEVVRGLSGAKPLTIAQIGMGVSLFDKSKAPSSGNAADWPGWPEYRQHYLKLWGVK